MNPVFTTKYPIYGRHEHWLEFRPFTTDDIIVQGWSKPTKSFFGQSVSVCGSYTFKSEVFELSADLLDLLEHVIFGMHKERSIFFVEEIQLDLKHKRRETKERMLDDALEDLKLRIQTQDCLDKAVAEALDNLNARIREFVETGRRNFIKESCRRYLRLETYDVAALDAEAGTSDLVANVHTTRETYWNLKKELQQRRTEHIIRAFESPVDALPEEARLAVLDKLKTDGILCDSRFM